ncbi:MAG TPA: hypothetical protein VNT52_13395, partial [Acidimicrobiales bacterium]|nr:hypothetical protein [Acidimicrobiales bacterium]
MRTETAAGLAQGPGLGQYVLADLDRVLDRLVPTHPQLVLRATDHVHEVDLGLRLCPSVLRPGWPSTPADMGVECPQDQAHQPPAKEDRDEDEHDREERLTDADQAERAAGGQAGHHRQEDPADGVVDHPCGQGDLADVAPPALRIGATSSASASAHHPSGSMFPLDGVERATPMASILARRVCS